MPRFNIFRKKHTKKNPAPKEQEPLKHQEANIADSTSEEEKNSEHSDSGNDNQPQANVAKKPELTPERRAELMAKLKQLDAIHAANTEKSSQIGREIADLTAEQEARAAEQKARAEKTTDDLAEEWDRGLVNDKDFFNRMEKDVLGKTGKNEFGRIEGVKAENLSNPKVSEVAGGA